MDIIICTYNNAQLLDRTLTAIGLQQIPAHYDWNVLVVDNNCTDETPAIVEKHIAFQKIPYLRRIVETKQGLTSARICGITNTTSEWVAFVDDDCLISQNWINNAIEFSLNHPNCGAFGGKVILDWETQPSSIIIKHSRTFAALNLGEVATQLNRNNFHLPGAGLIVNRTALNKSGWLNKQFLTGRNGKKLTAGDDSEIVLRIINAGYELWYTPNCVLHHFIPTRRISENYLVEMNYGFGIAAPYIAILRWHSSYFMWLTVCLLRIIKYLLETVVCGLKTFTNSENRLETLIKWKWTKGQIDSLLIILTMSKEERSNWLSVFE